MMHSEFVAIMPSTDAASALAAAERMRSSFADEKMKIGEQELLITVSIGVAVLDAQDQVYSHLLRRSLRPAFLRNPWARLAPIPIA